jgi:hypothetical protein
MVLVPLVKKSEQDIFSALAIDTYLRCLRLRLTLHDEHKSV